MTSRPTDPRLSRFERKRKDGTRYVYERETRYNPEKGYTETLRTSLLYKITASGDRIATNGVGRGMRPAAADAARAGKIRLALRSTFGDETGRAVFDEARDFLKTRLEPSDRGEAPQIAALYREVGLNPDAQSEFLRRLSPDQGTRIGMEFAPPSSLPALRSQYRSAAGTHGCPADASASASRQYRFRVSCGVFKKKRFLSYS